MFLIFNFNYHEWKEMHVFFSAQQKKWFMPALLQKSAVSDVDGRELISPPVFNMSSNSNNGVVSGKASLQNRMDLLKDPIQ